MGEKMPEAHAHFAILRVRMFWITVCLSGAIIAAFVVASWSLKNSHDNAVHQRNVLCDAENQANDVMRKVLKLAADASAGNSRASKDERVAAELFYRRALKLVDHVPCKS